MEDDRASITTGVDEEHSQLTNARWRSLFRFTSRSHYLALFLAVISAILSGVCVPALAYFLGGLFTAFTSYGASQSSVDQFLDDVKQHVIYITILGGLNWVLCALFLFCWLVFGELQARTARYQLYACMLDKEMEWFDMRTSGISALMPRVRSHIGDLQLATSQPLGFLCQYSATIIAAVGLALYSSWDLTLIVVASAPIGALILNLLSKRLQLHIQAQAICLETATKLTNAALSAIETVKCANAQTFELKQYLRTIHEAAMSYFYQARLNAAQHGFVRFLTLTIFVQGFWYGSHLVNSGSKNSGQVLTAFWACLIATQTFEGLLGQLMVLQKGRAAGEILYSILTNIEDAKDIGQFDVIPGHCDGDVQLAEVSFAYPSSPGRLVLDNVSMFFAAGDLTFVVGKSGSGKSTLSSLLLCFYAATGKITIDGKPIDNLNRSWLRNNITVMQQQSVLFNESILKNIAFGIRKFATIGPKDIEECLRYAALEETIASLPHGMHTIVGPGGNLMSGGQRQRIAIARAKLRDTPILIFDEATSALDRNSADIVMQSIRQWRKGKTTIIITHDLSQVLPNDYVYVMDSGKVVQEGFRSSLERTSNDGGFSMLVTIGTRNEKPLPIIPASPISPSQQQGFELHDDISVPKQDQKHEMGTVSGQCTMTSAWAPIRQNQQTSMERRITQRNEQDRQRLSTQFASRRHSITHPFSEATPSSSVSSPKRDSVGSATENEYNEQYHPFSTIPELEADSSKTTTPLLTILSTIYPNLQLRQRLLLILGYSSATIHAIATPVFSWVFSKLLATYLSHDADKSQQALKWSVTILAIAIIDGIMSFLMHFLLEVQGQNWVNALRRKAYERILDQPRAWFDAPNNSTDKLVNVLDRNAEDMRNLLGRFLGLMIVTINMIVIAVVWSLILCWKLTLVGLACGPVIYAVTGAFNTVNARWERRCNEAAQPVSESFAETFGNIRTVRALTLEDYFHHKHAKATKAAMQIGVQRAVWSGLFFGVSDATVLFVIALLFWYSSVLVVHQDIPVQTIMTVVSMLLFTLTAAASMLTSIPQINLSRDTATRLLRLVNLPYGVSHEHSGDLKPSELKGSIEITNLTFTYASRPQKPALRNLTLEIPLHSSTAIVGVSGSGKSTSISLLLGLHIPSRKHSIKIGSVSLLDIDMKHLRSMVAISPQNPPIFPTSIKANIAYALVSDTEPLTEGNLVRAAKLAGIHSFITSLPQGYDTPIGEGGSLLSGGQIARIGLARAIFRQPRILILDEPTAGLDGLSRAALVRLIRKLVQEGTAVIVATHDQILKHGCDRVVELKPFD